MLRLMFIKSQRSSRWRPVHGGYQTLTYTIWISKTLPKTKTLVTFTFTSTDSALAFMTWSLTCTIMAIRGIRVYQSWLLECSQLSKTRGYRACKHWVDMGVVRIHGFHGFCTDAFAEGRDPRIANASLPDEGSCIASRSVEPHGKKLLRWNFFGESVEHTTTFDKLIQGSFQHFFSIKLQRLL